MFNSTSVPFDQHKAVSIPQRHRPSQRLYKTIGPELMPRLTETMYPRHLDG